MMPIASVKNIENALREKKELLKRKSKEYIKGFEDAQQTVSDTHKALGEELEQAWINRKNEEAKQFISDPEEVRPLDPKLLDEEGIYEE